MNKWMIDEDKKSKEAIEDINGKLLEMTSHIVKCWYMPNSLSYKHWLSELKGWLLYIIDSSRIKTKRGVLSQKVCTRSFRRAYDLNILENILDGIEYEYPEFNNVYIDDIEVIRKRLIYFHENLWREVSMKQLNIQNFLNKMGIM